MGSSQSGPKDKKIVVVGGGYAGAFLCTQLLKQGADFVLIDPKSFFFHNVASVRAVVDPSYTEKLCIPYAKTFGDHFKQGKVTSLKPGEQKVVLESGEEIDYDVLVLATGSQAAEPFKYNFEAPSDGLNTALYTEYAEKVKNASKIVIVGGGPIGCEIAGEIQAMYKDKEVTLIHSGQELVYKGGLPKFQSSVQQKLRSKGVKIVLGQKATNLAEIDNTGRCDVRTEDGTSYPADFVFKCTGNVKTDLSYAQDSLGESFDEHGLLKVNEFFQVSGHDNIFAMGDCCNADVMKLAFAAGKHIPVINRNIAALLNKGAMKPYKPERGPHYSIAISIGPKDGVLTFNGMVLPTFIIVSQKSKDLMVNRFWKDLKQKPPR